MKPLRFTVEGAAYDLRPGRARPGLPSWHVERNGLHVSLAYPEAGEHAVLFDDRKTGFRLELATGAVTAFPRKREYWAARNAAGWPARRRKGVAI